MRFKICGSLEKMGLVSEQNPIRQRVFMEHRRIVRVLEDHSNIFRLCDIHQRLFRIYAELLVYTGKEDSDFKTVVDFIGNAAALHEKFPWDDWRLQVQAAQSILQAWLGKPVGRHKIQTSGFVSRKDAILYPSKVISECQ